MLKEILANNKTDFSEAHIDVLFCYEISSTKQELPDKIMCKIMWKSTFKSAAFSSRILPMAICSIVQIVVLLLKHFYRSYGACL